MIRHLMFHTLAATALLTSSALAQTTTAPAEQVQPARTQPTPATPTKRATAATQDFVNKAAVAGLFEVETSKLAVDKAQRADTKTFAQQLITDHEAANRDLQGAATNVGANVPAKLDSRHVGKLVRLKRASAAAFDDLFLREQADSHREAIAVFTRYSRSGDNAELKAFAVKTLPTLQAHDAHVTQANKSSTAPTKANADSAPVKPKSTQ